MFTLFKGKKILQILRSDETVKTSSISILNINLVSLNSGNTFHFSRSVRSLFKSKYHNLFRQIKIYIIQ